MSKKQEFLAVSNLQTVLTLLFALAAIFITVTPGAYGEVNDVKPKTETIVVGGGCFWCMEAVFQSFKGVEKVVSGYAGGERPNPTYHDLSSGTSGHAEVVEITFNPDQIPLKTVLTIFFHAHDPTTKDRQGNDVGSEYRSMILYSSDEQRKVAEQEKKEITDAKVWGDKPLVTEIVPLTKFFRAEEYHQNYYLNNPSQPYCQIVVGPKVQKVRHEFHDLLKPILP